MKTNHKAIVFDYGGVIEFFASASPLRTAAEELHIPLNELQKVYYAYNHLSNVENISWFEMFRKVISTFDISVGSQDRVLKILENNYNNSMLNTELISFLPVLKKQGPVIALFSNSSSALREKLERQRIASFFDYIIISGEIGSQKPTKESFAILFETLALSPSEVIFIDDTPKSLETADEIGYKPILFKNNVQLKAELLQCGFLL